MNVAKRIAFTVVLWSAVLAGALSQATDSLEQQALDAFYAADYPRALTISKKKLAGEAKNPTALYVAGESARKLKDYLLAEKYLEQVPENTKRDMFFETDFWLAQTKKVLGKYDEAIYHYEKYLESNEDDSDLLYHFAKEEIKSCQWEKEQQEKDPANLFEVHVLNKNINKKGSEIAPLRYADKMYFTAVYPGEKDGRAVSRIYSAIKDYPARLETINPKDEDIHAAHITLTPDASQVYYTICKDERGNGELRCEIWTRKREYEGHWGAPFRLPRHINWRGATSLHPTIGWDMFLKKYILYYASDRPGGQGGIDIWASVIQRNGEFGEPFNVPFNTPGDEVTPYFNMPSQTIFFSSNGLQGSGGFDVYYANKVGKAQWQLPVNMGEPLNTTADEYYYTYHTRSKRGYFASNRGCDAPTADCPTDIFDAEIFSDLQLRAFNTTKSVPVVPSRLAVMDTEGKTIQYLAFNPEKNAFSTLLETDRYYQFVIMADGFKPAYLTVLTRNQPYPEILIKEVFLEEGEASVLQQQELEQYFKKTAVGSGEEENEIFESKKPKVIKP